jgi:Protein of unknown function (DUF3421)
MNKSLKTIERSIVKLSTIALSIGAVMLSTQPVLADYEWLTARNGFVPVGSIKGGFDGENLYVCSVNGIPGKLNAASKRCYIPYDGREYEYSNYKVLVGNNLQWIPLTGNIPKNAIVVGKDYDTNTNLYICSGVFNGKETPGKYHIKHNICYVPDGGKEIQVKKANILTTQ